MSNATKGKYIRIFATIVCVLAPFIATCCQFPIWVRESSQATMSGIFLVCVFLSCLPFVKQIKTYMKNPSAWVVWLCIFVFVYVLSQIIRQMVIVAAVGFIANIIGTVIYKIAEIIEKKPDIVYSDNESENE